jgi:hypothetical protein
MKSTEEKKRDFLDCETAGILPLKEEFPGIDSSTDFQNSNSKFLGSKSLLSTMPPMDEDYLSKLPAYMTDGTFGIDRIRIAFLIDPNSVTQQNFLSNVWGSRSLKTRGMVKLPGQSDIYLHWPDTGDQFITLEFNPSNFSRVDGLEICPPVFLSHYVEEVIRSVLSLGEPSSRPIFMSRQPWDIIGPWPKDWTAHMKINGLHLARDLRVTDSRFSLEQMRLFKPHRMSCVTLHVGQDGKVETVTHPASRSTTRHMVYDKVRERQKALASTKRNKSVFMPVADGTFRYEIQMPYRSLRDMGIKILDVLTPERLLKMALNQWSKSNYFKPLIWEGQLASELTTVMVDSDVAKVLQYVINLQTGTPMSYSRKEIKSLEILVKKAGISKKKSLSTQGMPYGMLDFEAGGLILFP